MPWADIYSPNCPFYSTGQGNTLHRETVERTHVCIYGFIQPYPFIGKVLPMIVAEDDGLFDRFLICAPKVHRWNVQQLAEIAQQKAALPEHMRDCAAVLQAINDCHDCIGPRKYLLSPEALRLFTQFEADNVDRFNSTAGLDVGTYATKDTRYVLRCATIPSAAHTEYFGHLHVKI